VCTWAAILSVALHAMLPHAISRVRYSAPWAAVRGAVLCLLLSRPAPPQQYMSSLSCSSGCLAGAVTVNAGAYLGNVGSGLVHAGISIQAIVHKGLRDLSRVSCIPVSVHTPHCQNHPNSKVVGETYVCADVASIRSVLPRQTLQKHVLNTTVD
jgi:hypothetical protein